MMIDKDQLVSVQVMQEMMGTIQQLVNAVNAHDQMLQALHAKVFDLHKRLVKASEAITDGDDSAEASRQLADAIAEARVAVKMLGESEIADGPAEPSRLVTV